MHSVLQDIRFGIRSMSKNPGFSVVAVLALTLGIGANATVYTLVNTVLFKNLPFADSERILSSRCDTISGKVPRTCAGRLDTSPCIAIIFCTLSLPL